MGRGRNVRDAAGHNCSAASHGTCAHTCRRPAAPRGPRDRARPDGRCTATPRCNDRSRAHADRRDVECARQSRRTGREASAAAAHPCGRMRPRARARVRTHATVAASISGGLARARGQLGARRLAEHAARASARRRLLGCAAIAVARSLAPLPLARRSSLAAAAAARLVSGRAAAALVARAEIVERPLPVKNAAALGLLAAEVLVVHRPLGKAHAAHAECASSMPTPPPAAPSPR